MQIYKYFTKKAYLCHRIITMEVSNRENKQQNQGVKPSNATQVPPRARRQHQRMRLPFDNRKQDFGEWAYIHRIGLLALLVAAIVFVGTMLVAKFKMNAEQSYHEAMYIDTRTLEEILEEKERLEREIERKQAQEIEWEKVRNMQSNDALVNEAITDDRGTDVEELNEQAEAVAERMAANRNAHNAGLSEVAAIGKREKSSETSSEAKGQDSHYKGGVTVRYKFENPVRNKRNLVIPAYRCEAGGQVEVTVVIDRGGEVVSAKVAWGGDEQMRREALAAARASTFNIDEDAPARQEGTITYTFIPQ